MSVRRSFDLLPSDTSIDGMTTPGRVIAFFNAKRNASMPVIHSVPVTLRPLEASLLAGVPEQSLILWTKRLRRPLPCWRISNKTVLFESHSLREWLAAHGVSAHPKTTTTQTQQDTHHA